MAVHKPAQHALAGGFLLTLILSGLGWQTPWPYIAAACLKDLVTAQDIMLIIFGAFVLKWSIRIVQGWFVDHQSQESNFSCRIGII